MHQIRMLHRKPRRGVEDANSSLSCRGPGLQGLLNEAVGVFLAVAGVSARRSQYLGLAAGSPDAEAPREMQEASVIFWMRMDAIPLQQMI